MEILDNMKKVVMQIIYTKTQETQMYKYISLVTTRTNVLIKDNEVLKVDSFKWTIYT